ncbi:metallophosphoesterase [Halobacteriovorax sp. ZH5_bin.2]|uniref:metallophosphoesterase n=1 Tax=unclassified Halobacteriovorax TaxID=2639665 RepID=UPI003712C600
MGNLNIIHLSDIHLNKDDQNWVNTSINTLHTYITSNCIIKSDPILLVLTGDIVNKGKKEEFDLATSFLIDLKTKMEDEGYIFNIVSCPGNHDLDFANSDDMRDQIVDFIRNGTMKISQQVIDTCTKELSNYFIFNQEIENEKVENKMQWSRTFNYFNKKITFNCFNSAWMSKIQEPYGAIVFDSNFLNINDGDVVFTITHHPSNWQSQNSMHNFQRTIEEKSDILLSGHEHTENDYIKTSDKNECLFLRSSIGKDGDQILFKHLIVDIGAKQFIVKNFNGKESTKEAKAKEFFRKQNFKKFKYQPKPEYLQDINSINLNLGHNILDKVLLNDIYIWPNLKVDLDEHSQSEIELRKDEYLKKFMSGGVYGISSKQHGGRTSFANSLFISLNENGKLPIIINIKDIIKKKNKNIIQDFKNYVSNTYIGQNYDFIPKEDKVLIIDNVGNDELEDDNFNDIIESFQTTFTTIVFLADESLKIRQLINVNYDFTIYSFSDFNSERTQQLIKKWITAGDKKNEYDPVKVSYYLKRVRETISLNFIPNTPFYIILIINNILSAEFDQDPYSSTSLTLVDNLINITLNNICIRGIGPEGLQTLLCYLAYYAYQEDNKLSPIRFKNVCDLYKTDSLVDFNIDKTKALLVKHRVLKEDMKQISFNNDFLYHYFIGKHIATNLEDHIKFEIEKELVKKSHKDLESSIIIFTAYFSTDNSITELMIKEGQEALHDIEVINLENAISSITNNIKIEKDYLQINNYDNPESNLNEKIERNEQLNNIVDTKEDQLNEANMISRSYRIINVLGQILQNKAGSMKGPLKLTLVEEIQALTARTISLLHHALETHLDDVYKYVKKIALERLESSKNKITISNIDLENDVKKLLSETFIHFSYWMIERISLTSGSSTLIPVFQKVANDNPTNLHKLAHLKIYLDHTAPDELDIEKLKANIPRIYLPMRLQKFMIYDYIKTTKLPISKKQRICGEFDIDINSVKIIEDKTK